MAHYAATALKDHAHIQVEFVDLAQVDLRVYPRSENDPQTKVLRELFEESDAQIFVCPIHNWKPCASLSNYLEYVLDPKDGRRYRPFLILAAAGSPRSHLACDGLARTVTSEIHGIQIGPPLLGAGDDINRRTGQITASLQQRIDKALTILVHHTIAAQALTKELYETCANSNLAYANAG